MSVAQNYHQWILEDFKPYLGRRVAEIGAGSGNFTEYLSKQVEFLTAFEPSDNMYPLLHRRFANSHKVDTIHDTFGQQYKRYIGDFDTIIYINVLEHVEEDKNELIQTYEILKPGGHVLIFVPALPYLFSNFDRQVGHYRRYLKSGLVQLVKDSGFNIRDVKYFDIIGIVPWYLFFVLANRTLTYAKVNYYDKIVIPLARKFEGRITPFIGKNLILAAQK